MSNKNQISKLCSPVLEVKAAITICKDFLFEFKCGTFLINAFKHSSGLISRIFGAIHKWSVWQFNTKKSQNILWHGRRVKKSKLFVYVIYERPLIYSYKKQHQNYFSIANIQVAHKVNLIFYTSVSYIVMNN